jgi:hypothetical protein
MSLALLAAAVGAAAAGIGHSYLGERWILLPLFHTDALPRTPVGGTYATRRMIRFTWHFFSVVAWLTAATFASHGLGFVDGGSGVIRVLAACWLAFGVAVLIFSRGRHGAWMLGLAVGVAAWLGS